MKPRSNDSTNKSFVLRTLSKIVADITFWEHIFFIINLLVSVADCGYIHLFCSYLSKNEAVKFSFMFCYNKILLYISPADLVSCNTSQIFFSAIHTDFLKRFQN